ncbi:Uncharacterised protein [Vibrio cholerae]|nr:Uncharacterised protein [Vibrio cholerae]
MLLSKCDKLALTNGMYATTQINKMYLIFFIATSFSLTPA